jgi:hypothetical protein
VRLGRASERERQSALPPWCRRVKRRALPARSMRRRCRSRTRALCPAQFAELKSRTRSVPRRSAFPCITPLHVSGYCRCRQATDARKGLSVSTRGCQCRQGAVSVDKGLSVSTRGCQCRQAADIEAPSGPARDAGWNPERATEQRRSGRLECARQQRAAQPASLFTTACLLTPQPRAQPNAGQPAQSAPSPSSLKSAADAPESACSPRASRARRSRRQSDRAPGEFPTARLRGAGHRHTGSPGGTSPWSSAE